MNTLKDYIIEKFKISNKIKPKKVLVIYSFNQDTTAVTDYEVYDSIKEAVENIKKKSTGRSYRTAFYCVFSLYESDINDLLDNICKLPAKKFEKEFCVERGIEDLEKELNKIFTNNK